MAVSLSTTVTTPPPGSRTPWVRSLTHSPDAVTHSPAEITAA